MAKKRYYVEQVDEEDETKKIKEQAEDNTGGILSKDVSASATNVEQPVNDAVPTDPLEKAKALTEEAGGVDMTDVLNQILAKLSNIEAKIASTEVKEQPVTEEAVGFEGDNPSGPSYSDSNEGGVQNSEEDTALIPKVKEPVENAIPDEDLEKANQLTERVRKRKTIVDSGIRESFNSRNNFLEGLKNYANKL